VLALPIDDPRDTQKLADWAELSCLLRDPREVSDGEIADVLHNSLLLHDEDAQDEAQMIAEEVFLALQRRAHEMRDGYPFSAGKNYLRASRGWEECICYSSLLVADLGNSYAEVNTAYSPTSHFPKLFEKVAQACLGCIFGGASVRFGVPRDPSWPRSIVDRIGRLAEEMGLEPDDPGSKVEPNDGDLGLDVATRIRLGDEEAGTGILLTQCATGRNFKAKKGEPPLDEWKRLIHWRSLLIRAVAFPWRRNVSDHKFGRLAIRFEAILLDRHRLNSGGNADGFLDEWARRDLAEWCRRRIAEFPLL
jgi:hypothetical protein